MMFSGEPAIYRVPGPWVVLVFGFWFSVFGFRFLVFGFWFLVFGFWFLVFGFWFLVFGRFSAGRTSVLQIFILFLLSKV